MDNYHWLIENRFSRRPVEHRRQNVVERYRGRMGLGYWQGSHMVNDEELLKRRCANQYIRYFWEGNRLSKDGKNS